MDRSRQELEERIKALEQACADMREVAEAIGAPVRILDQLAAASKGQPLPHKTILPFDLGECRPPSTQESGAALPAGISFERVADDKNGNEQFMILSVVANDTHTSTGHFINRIGPLSADDARKQLTEMLGRPTAAALDRIFRTARARRV